MDLLLFLDKKFMLLWTFPRKVCVDEKSMSRKSLCRGKVRLPQKHRTKLRRRRNRELVCHIDYLFMMRAKIARNASTSIGVQVLPCLLIQSTSFSESKYALFLSVVICQPVRWLPTLALVLCDITELQNLFYTD